MSRFNGKRGRFARFSISALTPPSTAYSVVTGGTLFSSDLYYYRLFTSSDAINISEAPLTADILVVAGGGSGASNGYYTKGNGAGGGAGGGYAASYSTNMPIGDYATAVGAGGAGVYIGSDYHVANGIDGSASCLYELSSGNWVAGAYGGGGGHNIGTYWVNSNGGSNDNFTGGLAASDQYGYNYFAGGGGASSSANGNNAIPGYRMAEAGSGANGPTGFESWLNITGVGADGTFGGGGGGQPSYNPFDGPATRTSAGGLGGGTIGVFSWWNNPVMPVSAPVNSGGGTGGVYRNPYVQVGNGGSGFIIMRYLKSEVEYVEPATTTVSGGSLWDLGDYYYRVFTSTDTLTVSNGSLNAEVLSIAGGGGGGAGGGYEAGGGGGAGGVVLDSVSLTPGNHTVFVGAGGSFNSYGNPSYIDQITSQATGGGFGGPYGGGGNGGSGGGAPGWAAWQQPGQGISGQGNNGGLGTYDYGGSLPGGGGGAGAPGENAISYTRAGNGGAGTNTYSEWATATNTGLSGYYAAGGGGGTNYWNGYPGGSGGSGGGGTGGYTGTSAVNNTGSGGGGSNNDYSYAGSGGSGLVILKYLKSAVAS